MFAETETAKHILSKKAYYLPEETGPDQMLRRVASYVASAFKDEEPRDYWDARFYDIMHSARFVPNSPCLVNAGRESGGLFACFVLGMDDNLDSITRAKSDAMAITKAGGGWGISLSSLRPYGSKVSGSTHGIAGGPVGFWETFSHDMRTMTQGGFRDAACMATMRIDHPDIFKFIRSKSPKNSVKRLLNLDLLVDSQEEMDAIANGLLKDNVVASAAETYMSNFNISVLMYDAFMETALAWDNEDFELPTSFGGKPYGNINPSKVLDEIAQGMWTNGEPGILFIDKIRDRTRYVPSEINATNPCVTGDTLILTVDGPKRIMDLVGKNVLVYSWDANSKLPKIKTMRNISKTREGARILEIGLDSGLVVRLTPDHNLRDFRGNKVMARDLVVGQSVRSFAVSKHRDGHLRAHAWVNGRAEHQWVHRMVWELYNGSIDDSLVINHVDGDPENNSIDNLELITAEKHNSIHYDDRLKNGFGRHGWITPESIVHKRISNGLKDYYRQNHKVLYIREAGHEDVYNGTVDGTHNYIIADPDYRGDSSVGVYSGIVSANCGEQPLPPNGSCCLGSINLAEHISGNALDEYKLKETVRVGVRFLNNMITLNRFPTGATELWSLKHRSIGLGVMGFADALILMGVRYDSKEAVEFAKTVGSIMLEVAIDESKNIYQEGYSRPVSVTGEEIPGGWDGRNNHVLLSIAPTGTISLLAGCSPGIEPVFSDKILRIDSTGSHMVSHPLVDHDAFVTLKDIRWDAVIDVVAAFSDYIDSSISYTVNMPNEATVRDVRDTIAYAWRKGCNGITIYRDGSRNRQVLNATGDTEKEDPLARPSVLDGKTFKYTGNIDGEKTNLYVTLNSKNGSPYEVFVHTPHIESMTELQLVTVVTRLSSLCMRYGIPTAEIVEQLRKAEGQSVTSVPAIITRAIAEYRGVSSGDCPECGGEMMYTGGCNVCPSCGHSSCG